MSVILIQLCVIIDANYIPCMQTLCFIVIVIVELLHSLQSYTCKKCKKKEKSHIVCLHVEGKTCTCFSFTVYGSLRAFFLRLFAAHTGASVRKYSLMSQAVRAQTNPTQRWGLLIFKAVIAVKWSRDVTHLNLRFIVYHIQDVDKILLGGKKRK